MSGSSSDQTLWLCSASILEGLYRDFVCYSLIKHDVLGWLKVSGKHKDSALGQQEKLHNGRNQSSFPPLLQLLLLEGALLSFWSCLWLLSVCVGMCVGMPRREKKVLSVHLPEEFLFLLEIWMHRTRGLELIFFFFFFWPKWKRCWMLKEEIPTVLCFGSRELFHQCTWGVLPSEN